METLVAAHRTMPFNTWLKVTNEQNGKTVIVRVIDRGPFVEGRIIDLSKAAARQIGLLGPGTGPVRLEVIGVPPPLSASIPVGPPTGTTPPPSASIPAGTTPPHSIVAPAPPNTLSELPASETPASDIPSAIVPPAAPAEVSTDFYAVQVGAFSVYANAEHARADYAQRYGFAQLAMRQGRVTLWRVLVGKEASMEAAQKLAVSLNVQNKEVFVVRLDVPAPQPAVGAPAQP
jgi:rare lipoprotein A